MKEVKIIKRYQNRKLYDTHESSYVTLDEIAKMIKSGEDLRVIDNKTKNDITASTLTQLLYESENSAFCGSLEGNHPSRRRLLLRLHSSQDQL